MPRVKRLDEHFVCCRDTAAFKDTQQRRGDKERLACFDALQRSRSRQRRSAGSAVTNDSLLWKQMHFRMGNKEKKIRIRFFLEFFFLEVFDVSETNVARYDFCSSHFFDDIPVFFLVIMTVFAWGVPRSQMCLL